MRLDGELPTQIAGAEHLDLEAGPRETRVDQRLGVDGRPVLEAAQLGEVDDLVDLLERVLEARQLRDALRERHLAALAPGVLAFLAAAGRLAATRAGAAPDALAALARTCRRLQLVKAHRLVAPLVLLVRALAPDLVLTALRPHVWDAFHGDQEVDGLEHAAHRVVVRQLAGLVQAAEAERLDGRADLGRRADRAFHQRRFDGFGRAVVPTRRAVRADLPACGEGPCLHLLLCHLASAVAATGSAPSVRR